MIDTYLFDWGDTLMFDLPHCEGKMCNWKTVEAVPNALEVLDYLSKFSEVFIATNAEESIESDIKKAFERVSLDKYISGYFCKSNLGVSKGNLEFYRIILTQLKKETANVAMVGDSLEKDIIPADQVGIKTYWFTSIESPSKPTATTLIKSLKELCI